MTTRPSTIESGTWRSSLKVVLMYFGMTSSHAIQVLYLFESDRSNGLRTSDSFHFEWCRDKLPIWHTSIQARGAHQLASLGATVACEMQTCSSAQVRWREPVAPLSANRGMPTVFPGSAAQVHLSVHLVGHL